MQIHPIWRQAIPTEVPTARVVLRPVVPSDAEELGEVLWTSRAHLAPWIPVPDVEPTVAQLRARLGQLAAAFAAGTRPLYALRERDGGALLGCVGLMPYDGGAALSLSYWLAAGATGRGYAREAVAALVDVAFASARVDRLVISCLRDNRRSARVARCLGFVQAGERGDLLDFELTRARHAAYAQLAATAAAAGVAHGLDERGVLSVAVADGGGAEIFLDELAGAPHAVVVADVAAEDAFAARDGLAHNATLAVGSLCLDRGRLALRHACPPADLSPLGLSLLLREASRLRRLAPAPAAAGDEVFLHYAA